MYCRRLLAYFIDVIPITIISAGFFWYFRDLEPAFSHYMANREDIEAKAVFIDVRTQARDFASLLCFIYFLLFERSPDISSVGKMALDLKVVQLDGSPITWKQSFHRNLLKFFSVLVMGLGFLYPLFNKKRLFLHDKLSGTKVVRRRSS